MGDELEKSGIHLTGGDSGWPVGGTDEPPHTKDGTGADPFPHVSEIADGAVKDTGTDEVQKVTLAKATGGSFTLKFSGKTTGDIAYNATAKAVREALEALSNIEPGDVEVTGSNGGPFTVTFGGQYVDTNVATLEASGAKLEGEGAEVTVATTAAGKPL
jgi:hypothetical protein